VPPAADERPTTRPEAEVPAVHRAPPPKDQPGPARQDQAQLDRPDQAQPDPETRTPQDPQDQVRPDRPDQAAAAVRPAPVEAPGRPEPDDAAPAAARLGAAAATAPAPGVERVAVPDDPSDAAEAVADREEVPETAGAPAAGGEGDPATVQAATAAAAPVDQAASPSRKRPDPGRRPARPARPGGVPPAPRPPSPSLPASPPTGGRPAGEGDAPRPQQPAARARPPVEVSPAERPTQPGAPAPGGREPEAAARTRPSVPPDAPEVLLAAAEVTDPAAGPTPGTPAGPPEPASPGSPFDRPLAGERPPDPRPRGRRARNLLRFTAPRRPESTEQAAAASDAPTPLADFDRLTQSIESVTEALGGQPLEFYERDLPQIAAAETARRVRADVVVLLLDNGEGLMEVSGGVGLTPAERRLSVEYSRDVMRELFRAGVGLIEDTDRVRGALAGIPGSRAETLVMVPLVHERLGFGVLMAGRNRSQTGVPTEVFSDAEIEVLMGFADAAAASLRTAVLLRHLKGQLKALEEEG
jgi:hypothetical protein